LYSHHRNCDPVVQQAHEEFLAINYSLLDAVIPRSVSVIVINEEASQQAESQTIN
jgi:hypothetical protein